MGRREGERVINYPIRYWGGGGGGGAPRRHHGASTKSGRGRPLAFTLQEFFANIHVVFTAEKHRRVLVERSGLDLEDALRAVARPASRLLDDECHRVALIHQT